MKCCELLFAAVLGTIAAVADAVPIDPIASPADNAVRYGVEPDAMMGRQSEFDTGVARFDFVGECCSVEDLLRLSGASRWSAEATADAGTPLSAFVVGPAAQQLQLIPAPGTLALAVLGLAVLGLMRKPHA